MTAGYSQDVVKRFYTQSGAETDSANSFYYKVWSGSGEKSSSYYTKSNTLMMEAGPSDAKGVSFRTYFFPTGSVRTKGNFVFSQPSGYFKSYHSNGTRQSELFFVDGSNKPDLSPAMKIVSYWDSLGNKLVDLGKGACRCNLNPFEEIEMIERGSVVDSLKSGEWEGTDKNNLVIFRENYDKGRLIRGVLFSDSQQFEYLQIETMASPKNGMADFYRHVGSTMRYPGSARRRRIQGKVYVEFVVEKDGSIIEVKTVKGIDPECDQEAVDAVRSSPKWNAGKQRGKPVKQRMVLPITFKLG